MDSCEHCEVHNSHGAEDYSLGVSWCISFPTADAQDQLVPFSSIGIMGRGHKMQKCSSYETIQKVFIMLILFIVPSYLMLDYDQLIETTAINGWLIGLKKYKS